MSERITPGRFHAADGLGDWRALARGARACFRGPSFATAVAFVGAVGELAPAERPPDLDVRSETVVVRLGSADGGGLGEPDIALARAISAAARDLGMTADPGAVQDLDITIDARATAQVRPFWRAVLGFEEVGDDDLRDPRRCGPSLWFQPVAQPRPGRNRIHVDVFVPHDVAEARVAAAVAAGGRVVYAEHAPSWWTVADGEGNEADIATWQGRDDQED